MFYAMSPIIYFVTLIKQSEFNYYKYEMGETYIGFRSNNMSYQDVLLGIVYL